MSPPGLEYGSSGLVPAVVQDAASRRVLMVGYQNPEALQATIETGQVHFWSRSRERLWRKGETSGNVLHVVAVEADCDRDAVLITARPAGPTCHTGDPSCFDAAPLSEASVHEQGFASLESLWEAISSRKQQHPPESYTASLLAGGVDAVSRKVVEEATEVLMAAKDSAVASDAIGRLPEEAADLIYHLLVLLAERDVQPREVLDVLADRAR
jgi:phosphoribosyl-ATP pyrophosphohydrolase/phosphoribosyl-AMP cyclohydrolase